VQYQPSTWHGRHIVAAQPVVLYRPNRVAAAYRRLALVILGMDVRTLADALRVDPAACAPATARSLPRVTASDNHRSAIPIRRQSDTRVDARRVHGAPSGYQPDSAPPESWPLIR